MIARPAAPMIHVMPGHSFDYVFEQYKGKSVYHCHILPHEDTGMMHNFLVT